MLQASRPVPTASGRCRHSANRLGPLSRGAAFVPHNVPIKLREGVKLTSAAVEVATGARDAGPTPGTAAANAAPAPATDSGPYQWHSQWYPVGTVEDLDPRRPHATHLLGIPLALWKDAQGQWRAVEDRCPHRLAPLSEGRVEKDGTLQCAYHGWQFDGRGACTHIPQLRNDEKAQATACASRRSCVRAYPTQVAHGLLWVLPDSSAAGWEKAAVPPSTAQLLGSVNDDGADPDVGWYVRDMPLRFDTLVENIADPSHVPFAHHGVQGRRSQEKGTKLTLQELGPGGFKTPFNMTGADTAVSFTAPSIVRYQPASSKTPFLILLAVPTRPGWSRLYHGLLNSGRKPTSFFFKILSAIRKIKWADHAFLRHPILDGDTYMLHVQERLLLEKDNDWKGSYYMPAPADGSVVATRRWFEEHGGAVPTCEPGTPMPPQLSKRDAIERYHQHTKHCKVCSQALRNVEAATWLAAVGGMLAALVLVARAVAGLPLLAPQSGTAALAGAVCAGLVALLRGLREQFIFVDYVHQDKN
ncbi:hypothetical protein HYH02_005270 [Chlamydomonas schloesseri]|uniref:Rieske domain-containing protein n=1 Tax=Chlamydomonas schloesseri TaxID=2026947 RepID=A0A835WL62_9CHLO|nr:hypothetical protein HYH02_005270 [Chlamydomonas schloesseri]|eukprot:KAG2449744.1 hypothetical protein HYH02_005270 [Chlamydomonas schloesseri]